jgi:hypothetical protein
MQAGWHGQRRWQRCRHVTIAPQTTSRCMHRLFCDCYIIYSNKIFTNKR